MPIVHCTLELETEEGVCIYNITPQVQAEVTKAKIDEGYCLVFCRHTTTAIAINEDEPRLWADIKAHLLKLAPPDLPYLHNDLDQRPNIPPDEPINAHSHLMAIALHNSEMIPILGGKLMLGTYQSILFFELDGARKREVLCQLFSPTWFIFFML